MPYPQQGGMNAPPPGAPPAPNAGAPQQYGSAPPPSAGPPAPGAPQPAPVPTAAPAPAPNAADPINRVDLAYLRGEAQQILTELVSALPSDKQARVHGIPLVVDSTVGEVNAFATCSGSSAAMAITDGLLDITAHMAEAKATDELFRTRKLDDYIALVARNQQPKRPIVQPPPGFFDPGQDADGRKVARQHQLLDAELAFVMGHELAHHYLGHLPCSATGALLTAAEINQVLTSGAPMLNQFNESAADVNGTNNLLDAGTRRSGYHFTEEGAMLVMQFFSGFDQFSPADFFDFERTHPPPQVRIPIIQGAANAWRSGLRLP